MSHLSRSGSDPLCNALPLVALGNTAVFSRTADLSAMMGNSSPFACIAQGGRAFGELFASLMREDGTLPQPTGAALQSAHGQILPLPDSPSSTEAGDLSYEGRAGLAIPTTNGLPGGEFPNEDVRRSGIPALSQPTYATPFMSLVAGVHDANQVDAYASLLVEARALQTGASC